MNEKLQKNLVLGLFQKIQKKFLDKKKEKKEK